MTDPQPDFTPIPGVADSLAADLRRILAPNPSAMTFRGTNTYLLGRGDIAVIDPGPALDGHLEQILAAIGPGQRISHIFVTHAHLDHSPLARPLSERTGAPVLGFGPYDAGRSAVMRRLAAEGLAGGGEGVDAAFAPDQTLADGEVVTGDDWEITALWTPGHMSNHLSFATKDALFCGDHVMGWATSLISPPDGDLGAFMASSRRLLALPERVYYPGHGAPIDAPHARLEWLMGHRKTREAGVIAALSQTPRPLRHLTEAVYTDIAPALIPAAERNLFAHLIDLQERGVVVAEPELSYAAAFRLAG